MDKKQPKLDPEIVKELERLNDHFRMKGKMSDRKYTVTFRVSNTTLISGPPQFPGTVITSRGIQLIETDLNLEAPVTDREHHLVYKDHIAPTVERTASKLREKLKDRYPDQYEEWKLGTEVYEARKEDQ
jgi:hypothetical protein